MSVGSFVFVLHSHLPYYRKAGMWPFGEESVYECMAETYLPLLNAIQELKDEGIKANLTIGITPVLCEQLSDKHMIDGFIAYLKRKIESADLDESKFHPRGESPNSELMQLARYYKDWYGNAFKSFTETWSKDLVGAFRKFQEEGLIEITTSCATHCLTPLLSQDSSLNLQFETGVKNYQKHFGRKPKGFWLPECAYRPKEDDRPGLGHWLEKVGIKYFFTESVVITGGETQEQRKLFGPYEGLDYNPHPTRPLTGNDTFSSYSLKDSSVAVMGRHDETGYQVWSKTDGYPGDGYYREFHKKDDISGLNYWRLTSKDIGLGEKHLYLPQAAQERVKENSDHYVGLIQKNLHDHYKMAGKPGFLTVAFDTELFGHWWFEGIEFIKQVIRKLNKYTKVELEKASDCLDRYPPERSIELPKSSWGSGGKFDIWQNPQTQWMWDAIYKAETVLNEIVESRDSVEHFERALKQASRELLLMQSSDWPFLVTTGQARQYAIERFKRHNQKFNDLIDMVKADDVSESKLKEIEDSDNCFEDIELKDITSIKLNVLKGTK